MTIVHNVNFEITLKHVIASPVAGRGNLTIRIII